MATRVTLAFLSAATLCGFLASTLPTDTADLAPEFSRSATPAEADAARPAEPRTDVTRTAVGPVAPSVEGELTADATEARIDPEAMIQQTRALASQCFVAETALARAAELLAREDLDDAGARGLGDLFVTMAWAAADRPEVLAMLEARVLVGGLAAEPRDFALCAIAQAETDASQQALVRVARDADTPRLRAASMRAMHRLTAPSSETLDQLVGAASLAGIEGSTSLLVLGALTGRGADGSDPGARLLAQEPAPGTADHELWLAAWGNTESPRAAEVATRSFRRATTVDGCLAALEAVRRAQGPLADQLLQEASRHESLEVRAAAERILAERGA